MKIRKKMLRRLTQEVLERSGKCTNRDIMERLERELGRPLTRGERIQVIRYLQTHYNIERVQYGSNGKRYPLTITIYL